MFLLIYVHIALANKDLKHECLPVSWTGSQLVILGAMPTDARRDYSPLVIATATVIELSISSVQLMDAAFQLQKGSELATHQLIVNLSKSGATRDKPSST